jgi:hypothetical protein
LTWRALVRVLIFFDRRFKITHHHRTLLERAEVQPVAQIAPTSEDPASDMVEGQTITMIAEMPDRTGPLFFVVCPLKLPILQEIWKGIRQTRTRSSD